MRTLLGHLAQFGSFSTQGEVLCTQGLAYLLREHGEARSAFADELAKRAGIAVGPDMTWLAEQRQPDGGRPDLEARIDNTAVVKVEAKLGAVLGPAQLQSYVRHLQTHPQGRRLDGILVVLVPPARIGEATNVVKEAFRVDGPGPWRAPKEDGPDIAITVVSWDDVLDAFGRVESDRFRNELEQFQGMYREFRSSYIAPLAGSAALVDWRNHPGDFVKLLDRVTRRLTTDPKVLPLFTEPSGYTLRYVRQAQGCDQGSHFSIGVRDPFDGFETPIWLRFHRETGCFRDIRARLQSSKLAPRVIDIGGHVWIPLDVPIGADAEHMVNALVAQAEAVRRDAY
ncbi:MAG: hypothetical protein M3P30_12770 [Chloroflexota bacterium]|nr:hypothetical protein [Chloroflexota bacterium]